MDQSKTPDQDSNDLNSLEEATTVVESTGKSDEPKTTDTLGPSSPNDNQPTLPQSSPSKPSKNPLRNRLKMFNVYLLLFLLVVAGAIVVVAVAVVKNRKAATPATVSTQTLTQKQLEQLATSDVNVGNSKQVLNVQSNAIFAGQVLIRQDLEVAGTIKAGGALNLPGITVSGTSSFSQIQTSTLAVSGNTAIQQQLTVSGALNVAGSATFAGSIAASQLTTNSLTLNSDLVLNHHINAGGSTPGRVVGPTLGNGGTVSVSGSDTAGSVNINTGSNATAGCLITVNFSKSFNATPHVVITPVGAGAAGLGYYINRSPSSFSICVANTPAASQTFDFDYIAFD